MCVHFDGRQLQVGIMLNDLTIDNMVVGGPAYKCKQLDRGDTILRVDGVEVLVPASSPFQSK